VSVVFLNPWDRLIGPNRYLVEMLRSESVLASRSLVALPQDEDAAREYRRLGCEAVMWPECSLVHPRVSASNLYRFTKLHSFGLARITSRLRAANPGVVVSNSENLLVGALASRVLGVPHLQVFHAVTFDERLRRRPALLRTYARMVAGLNLRVIAVSKALAAVLERAGMPPSKITVIPNPVMLEQGEDEKKGCQSEWKGSPLLVSAGRISHIKGQDLLVEALPAIVAEFPRLVCVFAGRVGSDAGGENTRRLMSRLERRVVELGVKENVRFAGEVESLAALLRQADLYVQPSRMESFGRVVAEALGYGTPVVAFSVGGVPEVAGDGALLVEPEDSVALSDAVIRALLSPTEMAEKASRGRRHVEKNYGSAVVAESFRRLLDSLTAESAA
jgi:glycosyltransferase involved in cell wall biosynthesis